MLLKKIKTNYLDKLFSDLVNKNDFINIDKELKKLKNNNQEFYHLFLNRVLNTYFNNDHGQEFFKNKIIWLNSFDISDTSLIKEFLSFYINQKIDVSLSPEPYTDALKNISKIFKIKQISFEDLVENSFLYQYEILNQTSNKNKLLQSNHAFFEKLPDKFFTHYYLTQCFFYVIKNPIHIYQQYREKYESQLIALNMISGLKEDPIQSTEENSLIIENTNKGWSTNVLSWSNPNVMNTFRGLLIKYEDLMNNPLQIFAEIISHLIQSGMDIDVDYELIEKFIEKNQHQILTNFNFDISISNQEKKKITREFGDVLEKFQYKI